VIERACVLADGPVVEVELGPRAVGTDKSDKSDGSDGSDDLVISLDDNERNHIKKALLATGGKVHGSDGAAAILGINPSTLRSRMRKLGIGKS
jgi:DNA-binding NtrC family response regulator